MLYLWCHWHSSAQLVLQYYLGIYKHLVFLWMVTREQLGICFLWWLKGSWVTNWICKGIWIYCLFHLWGVPEDLVVVVCPHVQYLPLFHFTEEVCHLLSTMLAYPLQKVFFPPRWLKEQSFDEGSKWVTSLLAALTVSPLNLLIGFCPFQTKGLVLHLLFLPSYRSLGVPLVACWKNMADFIEHMANFGWT